MRRWWCRSSSIWPAQVAGPLEKLPWIRSSGDPAPMSSKKIGSNFSDAILALSFKLYRVLRVSSGSKHPTPTARLSRDYVAAPYSGQNP